MLTCLIYERVGGQVNYIGVLRNVLVEVALSWDNEHNQAAPCDAFETLCHYTEIASPSLGLARRR